MSAPPAEDTRFIARAIELAERGWGRVQPNPLVGAVVVREGSVVGTGWHGRFGGPHAEVVALRKAGAAARGATLYVSLEPCAHTGKTPPCTDAILHAGVRRVVYAAEDPTADARGGAARLRDAGVEVVGGVLRERARSQNAPFFHSAERAPPWVALKLALTLDGRIAERPGQCSRITGAVAEADVHRLRAGFDAILIGARTAEVDDPRLTVRGETVPRVPPLRVVLDTAAALRPESRLLATLQEAPLLVCCGPDAPATAVERLRAIGAAVESLPATDGRLAPDAVLRALRERGARTVLCEGGATVAASLLAADLVDRLYIYLAPRLFGPAAPPAFPPPAALGEPGAWKLVDVAALADDARLTYDRARSA